MARKRKSADESPAQDGLAPSPDSAKKRVAKKRKIDWSAIDEFEGFTISPVNVKTPKKPSKTVGKKQRTSVVGTNINYPGQDAPLDADVIQPNPYPEAELSEVHVKISPALYWESTNRYRRFTINSEEFQVGQVVFVKNSEGARDKNSPDALQGWLAKVLEVRAGDASHVYLRVFWAYRPEDLPGGRQPHHGSSEVIVSNHMDIIEALTVQSSEDVVYWNDDPDSLPLPADQLFFRQSFDITKKAKPLSKLNMYCVDKQPINPEELLVQCSHCSEWLHAHCLEERAIANAAAEHNIISPPPPKKRGRPSKAAKANGDDPASKSGFAAELSTSDTSNLRLTVTDNRTFEKKRQWNVNITCLMCNKVIEKAEDPSQPSGAKTSTAHTHGGAVSDEADADGTTAISAQENENPASRDSEVDSVIGTQDPEEDAQTTSAQAEDATVSTPLATAEKKGETVELSSTD
ncbi:ebs-bah-phd domain-containing protein [Stemphylium lycopersici]|uniref:Ebs-bah-phd domain-containing protein n=1 Tax=Stemphylium lycopersici TaxID=183478 RepID=A0A364MXV4_STELY|nr:ebs-bah-phd domain-containing protein [Stemphylium lycopersici]